MGHLEVFIVIKRIPKSDYNYCNQYKNKKTPARMHLINLSKEVKSKMAKCKIPTLDSQIAISFNWFLYWYADGYQQLYTGSIYVSHN